MRIFEITGAPLTVVRTEKFHRNFQKFSKNYSSLVGSLDDFVNFKIHNPNKQHSRKDTTFNNGRLKSYRHEHLILGKVIIIYQIADGQLRLCDCVEHKAFEGASRSLIAYLDGLDPESFYPVTAEKISLSQQERKDIIALIYDLTQEQEILKVAIMGDFSKFAPWAEATISRSFKDILDAFGGAKGLIREIKDAMTYVGQI